MRLTVGVHLAPEYGDMSRLRAAWIEAEEIGADRIYTADHFFAMYADPATGEIKAAPADKNFEATTIQAAMAVTTSKPEIGCVVHGNSYRNPNLMADVARTIDHLSGGRYILGMGAGYLKLDYDEYGYEYGTVSSRLQALARDLPIIKARFARLQPPPLRRIPILIGASGEKLALRIAAEHADIWHAFGSVPLLQHKTGVLDQWCRAIGRNPAEIERSTTYIPQVYADGDPDKYLHMGFTHIMVNLFGPDWDLGIARELITWRDSIRKRRPELA